MFPYPKDNKTLIPQFLTTIEQAQLQQILLYRNQQYLNLSMQNNRNYNAMNAVKRNPSLNKNTSGAGSSLSGSTQSGEMAKANANSDFHKRSNFKLCLKNVQSTQLNSSGVRKLCENYGKVIDVHQTPKTPHVFVSFETLNGMERALEGLKNNEYGIDVCLSKQFMENFPEYCPDNSLKKADSISETHSNSGGAEGSYSRRTIKGPFTKNPRPNLSSLAQNSNIDLTKSSWHSNNNATGRPNRQSDNNINRNNNPIQNDRFKPKWEKNHDTTPVKAINVFDLKPVVKEDETSKDKPSGDAPEGNCIRCKRPCYKACQRCGDFYCSKECQTVDWQQHRFICFPMPNLIDSDSTEFGVGWQSMKSELKDFAKSNVAGVLKNISSANNNISSVANNISSADNRKQSQENGQNKAQKQMNKQQEKQTNHKQVQKNSKPQNSGQDSPNNKPRTSTDNSKKLETCSNYSASKEKSSSISLALPIWPKSGSSVAITAVIKSNFVYLRSLVAEDNAEYVKTINMINAASRTAKPLEKLPNDGDFAVCDFGGTGFYRVFVLRAVSDEKIAVSYLDFGNAEIKKLSDLRELPSCANNLKRFTYPVYLKNVPEFEMTDKVSKYLNVFVDEFTELKMLYNEDSENKVELIEKSSNQSINNKILELKVIKEPKLSDPPVLSQDIEVKFLPDGEDVPVFIFDNSLLGSGYVSCIHRDDIVKLEKFNKQFEEYAEKTSGPYTPRESELCLAQYEDDGKWYRAECVEVVGDGKPAVQFIDFGNISCVPISKIRKYPKEFNQPCLTSTCLIAGLPEEINDNLVEKLKKIFPMNEPKVLNKVKTDLKQKLNIIYLDAVEELLKSK